MSSRTTFWHFTVDDYFILEKDFIDNIKFNRKSKFVQWIDDIVKHVSSLLSLITPIRRKPINFIYEKKRQSINFLEKCN